MLSTLASGAQIALLKRVQGTRLKRKLLKSFIFNEIGIIGEMVRNNDSSGATENSCNTGKIGIILDELPCSLAC